MTKLPPTHPLQAGIEALKANRKGRAQELLMQAVKQDPKSEAAWLWLAAAMDENHKKKACLERALSINPGRQSTYDALARLSNPPAPIILDDLITLPTPAQVVPSPGLMPSSQPAPAAYVTQPITGGTTSTLSTIVIILLVCLGLLWIGVGLLQLAVMLDSPVNDSTIMLCGTGVWNIIISLVNLGSIKGVMRKEKRTYNTLIALSVIGVLWGVIQLFSGVWVQLLAVPAYVILGIMIQMEKELYINLTEKESKAKEAERRRFEAARAKAGK
jgi:hypothetical protein